MVIYRGSIVGFMLAGVGVANATMPPIFDWLDKSIWRRIDITGRRSLGFHQHSVVGDRDAFNLNNYFGQGQRQFTDTGHITLVGNKVLGFFNFNMTLTDSRYSDPQSKRIWLSYEAGGFQLGYGDLTSVSLLNTNEFARYTKTLSGATAGYEKGRFAVKAIRTESKSSARTRSLQGSNITGPYYIGDSQIVNDSEEIKVDGISMKQGLDYTINYQVGTINFVSRVIAPTSTIVVSYETLGFNRSSGTVQGAGMSYDFGQYGRLGVTALEQKTGGGSGLNSLTKIFMGKVLPEFPYDLDFEPLMSRPFIVRVGTQILNPGTDYTFGRDNAGNTIYALVYIRQGVPSTTEVRITYTPKPVQTIDGDRRVFGFDYRLPLGGKKGFLSYSQATGELKNGIAPLKGTARGIRGEYTSGDYKFRANFRDVPNDFVTVESRSFNRNEKSTDVGFDYRRKGYSWGASAMNTAITYRTVTSDNKMVVNNSRYANQRGYVAYEPPMSGVKWALEHNRSQSRYLTNNTRIDTTTFSASKSFGALNTRLAVEHQNGFGPVTVDSTTKVGAVSLDAIRLYADYALASGWSFGTRTSLSSTKSLGKSGKGNDITLSTSFKPANGPFDFDSSYTVSNSGSLAGLGFQNGSGIGYEGSGFGGTGGGSSYANGASNYRLLTFNPNYRVNQRASLNGRFYNTTSSGGYNSNAETTSFGLGVTWDLGGGTMFMSNVDRSATRFFGYKNKSEVTALDLALMGSPKGPWSYRLGMTSLLSGKTQFAQDSFGLDGFLRFRLNKRSNAMLQFNVGRTSGYMPQSETFVGMFYEYQIYANVALVGSYKFRRLMTNETTASFGGYRSSGFDLELNFNFGG